MATFKYTQIPPFTKRDGNALLFDQDGSLEYYIPDDYFGDGKSTSAVIEGSYVKLMGSFYYRILNANGTPGKFQIFHLPTMFVCQPGKIESIKDIQIEPHLQPSNYQLLTFYKGDQLISRCFVEQKVDNLGELFRLHLQTGKIPNSIPYNKLYSFPLECMTLNSGGQYNAHSQAVGLLYSKICRDPEDISRPFRLSKAIDKSMTGYTPISIKAASKQVSPFVSMTSENMDEAIMSAVLLSDEEKKGKRKHQESPLERVMMM